MKKYLNNRANKEIFTAVTIPFEFTMACKIYNMSTSEVLQCFIDHISFYDSLSQRFNGSYSFATNALLTYPYTETEEMSSAFSGNREEAIKCIQGLVALVMQADLTEAERTHKSVPIINRLYKMIRIKRLKHAKLHLDEKTTLQLTIDFRLFCEIHDIAPAKYLEYFMNNISLSDISARINFDGAKFNPAAAFFSELCSGYGNLNNDDLPYPELHFNFIDRMQEMHLRTLFIRNLDQKKQMYHEVYYAHYLKLVEQSENKDEN